MVVRVATAVAEVGLAAVVKVEGMVEGMGEVVMEAVVRVAAEEGPRLAGKAAAMAAVATEAVVASS